MVFVPWDFKLRSSTMPLTVKQKTKVVALWYEIKSYVDTRQRFYREYDLRTHDGPTNCAIQRIVKHFEHKGAVHNQSRATVAGQYQSPRAKPTSMPCGILQWTVPKSPTASAPGS